MKKTRMVVMATAAVFGVAACPAYVAASAHDGDAAKQRINGHPASPDLAKQRINGIAGKG